MVVQAQQVRSTSAHDLGPNTKAFFLSDKGKDIFFTITEPEYRDPKGTIVYFHGPNEFSELMKNKSISGPTRGYRVVTYDQPGAGRSSKDAIVGNRNILHTDSIETQSEAATKVVDYIQNVYRPKQGGDLHFVGYSTGALIAMDTIRRLPSGSVGSLTGISPMLDIDVGGWTADFDHPSSMRKLGKSSDHINTELGDDGIEGFSGKRVISDLKDFSRAVSNTGASRPRYPTDGYAIAVGNYLDDIHIRRDNQAIWRGGSASKPEIASIPENSQIDVAFVYDGKNSIFGFSAEEWVKEAGLEGKVRMTDLGGAGVDMHRDPRYAQSVFSAIQENIEGCVYVQTVDGLKTIIDTEWERMSERNRKQIQRDLVSMGYDIGPAGVDGKIRKGAVSDTEHALAGFITAYLDRYELKKGDAVNFEFTPENVKGLVDEAKFEGFSKPTLQSIQLDERYDILKDEITHGSDDGHKLSTSAAQLRSFKPF